MKQKLARISFEVSRDDYQLIKDSSRALNTTIKSLIIQSLGEYAEKIADKLNERFAMKF